MMISFTLEKQGKNWDIKVMVKWGNNWYDKGRNGDII